MSNFVLGFRKYSDIKNIIFDLGGVLLTINYELTLSKFKEFGFENIDKAFTEFKQIPMFNGWDKGFISPEQFRSGIREISSLNLSDSEIDSAWNAMIIDMPKKNIDFLLNIKKHFRTFLLSNTNEIHLDYLFNYTSKNFGIDNFDSLFEKPFYSCRIGMRKPDNEIYNFVLKENGLNPNETLFIDDSPTNIEAAQKIGIQGFCIKKEELITDLLKVQF